MQPEEDNVDELVQLVSEKAGISEEAARTAVVTVLDFLKDRLPAPISAQLDGAIEGGGLADAAKGLSGLLGKKK
jgi:uncharacterized protein (DUF2267 family)